MALKFGMKLVFLLASLCVATASAAEVHCAVDADCAGLGAGYQCAAQKTACAEHPESSTCVERVCRKKPAGPVKEADRACKKDSDCAVVLLRCECMYCAREADAEAGIVAAVSKRRAKAYESLARCSPAQQAQCAMAGACAITGDSAARCREKACVVVVNNPARFSPGAM